MATIDVPGIYAPDGWDRGWQDALEQGASAPVRLLALGDSITQGQFPTAGGAAPAGWDYRSSAWFHKLVALLLAKYAGRGLVESGEFQSPLTESKVNTTDYVSPNYAAGAATGLRPFVVPGTTGEVAGAAFAARLIDANGWWRQIYSSRVNTWSALGDELIRWNAPAYATRADVIWEGHGATTGGTFKVNILGTPGTGDTTVTVNFTSNDDGSAGDNGEPQVTTVYSGATPLAQPVLLGNQSASSVLRVLGCMAWRQYGHGLEYGRMAYGGRTLAEMVQTSSVLKPADKLASLFDPTDGYTGFPRRPHLTIIGSGTNDNNQNVSALSFGPSGYRAGLERTIGAIRRWNPTAAILIFLPWHSTDFSDQPNQVNNSAWGGYQRAAASLARTWGCAYLDFTRLWEPTPATETYTGGGDAHPSDEGYRYMAQAMADVA